MRPRDRRWRVLSGLVVLGSIVLAASPAWAHVEVDPGSEPRASAVVFAFRVPNEEQSASSVRLDVQFPTDHPFLNVLVEDKPGWTFTTQTGPLPKPVTTDDGTFTTAVTEVSWVATGSGIPPGAFERFNVFATTPSSGSKVTFKAIQTYSNGDVVRWIELPVKGAPKPDHPAPVLNLTKAPPSSG
jgi:periplasmic copper chaperone A